MSRNLLQSYVIPILIIGRHKLLQSKALGHHTEFDIPPMLNRISDWPSAIGQDDN